MMTNLFTIFDPSSSQGMSLNWISMMTVMMTTTPLIWISGSKMNYLLSHFKQLLLLEFKMILGTKSMKEVLLIISVFIVITTYNIMGLFPYIFNGTSQMVITLSISLPMWLGANVYGWSYKTNLMFAHLLPQTTPKALMPFMVLIETTSNSIRPFTLAVRLMANMVAGHLLMTLLGNLLNGSEEMMIIPEMMVQIMLTTLETAVAVIQAYVFSVLMTLYINEIPSN